MRQPIPDDWDRQTWACVQIQWPSSAKWIALLSGLLSQHRRGWTWDERTGDLIAAIAAGERIWEKNRILKSCNGDIIIGPEIPGTPELLSAASPGPEIGEEEMPCIDLTALIRIHDGVLQVRNACCEWIDVGDLTTITKPPTNTDPEDPPPADLACRKAYVIMHYLNSMARAAAVCMAGSTGTWGTEWFACFQGSYSQFSMDQYALITGVKNALVDAAITTGGEWDIAVPSGNLQTMICRLADLLSADSLAVTDFELSAIKSVILNVIVSTDVRTILLTLVDQLRTTGLTWISLDGEHESGASCDCPEAPTPEAPDLWPELEWYHRFDFADYGSQPAILEDGGQGSWVANLGLASINSTNNRDIWPVLMPYQAAGQIRRIAFKIRLAAGGTHWDDQYISVNNVPVALQDTFPVSEPYAAAEVWWEAACDQPAGTVNAPDCVIYGGATGLPETDSYRYICTQIAVAGTGTDPFIPL